MLGEGVETAAPSDVYGAWTEAEKRQGETNEKKRKQATPRKNKYLESLPLLYSFL